MCICDPIVYILQWTKIPYAFLKNEELSIEEAKVAYQDLRAAFFIETFFENLP